MISIVIPVAGNNFDRRTRLLHCLRSLRRQQTTFYTEIIIVEQSLDGNWYHDDIKCDSYYAVSDPLNRGFNLSWLRNIGAKKASGSHVVLMDMDIIVPKHYIHSTSYVTTFAFGAKAYLWLSRNDSEAHYRGEYSIDNACTINLSEHYNVMIPGVRGGCGCVLVFNREFFDTQYGGFWEGFHNWGFEDTESAHRLLSILDKKEVKDLPKVDAIAAHLYHDYDRQMNTLSGPNKELCDKLNAMDAKYRVELLKTHGVGKLERPTVINV